MIILELSLTLLFLGLTPLLTSIQQMCDLNQNLKNTPDLPDL